MDKKLFEEELRKLIDHARLIDLEHEELEMRVAELHRKHGREVPPPITGTLTVTEPNDRLK